MIKKEYPKITIITPSYNQVNYLEDTIRSVICQQYPNLEYIIIDGGSNDGSVEIIKKYENQLAYWVSEADNGMYYAIQKGFEKSTGEIMAWINSDDMYHRNALFTVSEIFSTFSEISWLEGFTTFFDEKGRTVNAYNSRRFSKYDFYSYDYEFIQQESCFWRRSLWEKAGSSLNCNLVYAGDFALWLKFFSFEKLYVTNALIGGFRIRSCNQLSLDHRKEYIEEVKNEIAKTNLSKEEIKALMFYKFFKSAINILKYFKIFRTNWLIEKISYRLFSNSKRIEFNQFTQKFELKT